MKIPAKFPAKGWLKVKPGTRIRADDVWVKSNGNYRVDNIEQHYNHTGEKLSNPANFPLYRRRTNT